MSNDNSTHAALTCNKCGSVSTTSLLMDYYYLAVPVEVLIIPFFSPKLTIDRKNRHKGIRSITMRHTIYISAIQKQGRF